MGEIMNPKDDQHDDMAVLPEKKIDRNFFRRLQSLEEQVETLRQQIRDNGGFNIDIENLKRANDLIATQVSALVEGHEKLLELIGTVVDVSKEPKIILPGRIN
jgi:hypothetical protein